MPKRVKFDKKFICLSLTAGGCIVANIFIWATKHYQEFTLLVNKYLSLYDGFSESEQEEYLKFLKSVVIYPYIIANCYTLAAFEGAFARILITKITDKNAIAVTTFSQPEQLSDEERIPLIESNAKPFLYQFRKLTSDKKKLSLPSQSELGIQKQQLNHSKEHNIKFA